MTGALGAYVSVRVPHGALAPGAALRVHDTRAPRTLSPSRLAARGISMKERLIGDDQLLVTADTTLGDPLWDWVAADAARRAPDGWRIANIGAVATTAPPAAQAYGYAPAPTGVALWILYRK